MLLFTQEIKYKLGLEPSNFVCAFVGCSLLTSHMGSAGWLRELLSTAGMQKVVWEFHARDVRSHTGCTNYPKNKEATESVGQDTGRIGKKIFLGKHC